MSTVNFVHNLLQEYTSLQNESKRKSPEIKSLCDKVIAFLQQKVVGKDKDAAPVSADELACNEDLLKPISQALSSKLFRLEIIAANIMQKLAQYRCLPQSYPSIVVLLNELSERTNTTDVHLKLIQIVLPLVTNYSSSGEILFELINMLLRLVQTQTSNVVHGTAAATLRQLTMIVFDRCKVSASVDNTQSGQSEQKSNFMLRYIKQNQKLSSLSPAQMDCYLLYHDLISLISGIDTPLCLRYEYIEMVFGLDLVESIVNHHHVMLKSGQQMLWLTQERLIPFIASLISSGQAYPLHLRAFRFAKLFLSQFRDLSEEFQLIMTLLIEMMVSSQPILSLEVLRDILLVKQGQLDFIQCLVKSGCLNSTIENVTSCYLKSLQPGFDYQVTQNQFKQSLLDQVDKMQQPQISSSYFCAMALECWLLLVDFLKTMAYDHLVLQQGDNVDGEQVIKAQSGIQFDGKSKFQISKSLLSQKYDYSLYHQVLVMSYTSFVRIFVHSQEVKVDADTFQIVVQYIGHLMVASAVLNDRKVFNSLLGQISSSMNSLEVGQQSVICTLLMKISHQCCCFLDMDQWECISQQLSSGENRGNLFVLCQWSALLSRRELSNMISGLIRACLYQLQISNTDILQRLLQLQKDVAFTEAVYNPMATDTASADVSQMAIDVSPLSAADDSRIQFAAASSVVLIQSISEVLQVNLAKFLFESAQDSLVVVWDQAFACLVHIMRLKISQADVSALASTQISILVDNVANQLQAKARTKELDEQSSQRVADMILLPLKSIIVLSAANTEQSTQVQLVGLEALNKLLQLVGAYLQPSSYAIVLETIGGIFQGDQQQFVQKNMVLLIRSSMQILQSVCSEYLSQLGMENVVPLVNLIQKFVQQEVEVNCALVGVNLVWSICEHLKQIESPLQQKMFCLKALRSLCCDTNRYEVKLTAAQVLFRCSSMTFASSFDASQLVGVIEEILLPSCLQLIQYSNERISQLLSGILVSSDHQADGNNQKTAINSMDELVTVLKSGNQQAESPPAKDNTSNSSKSSEHKLEAAIKQCFELKNVAATSLAQIVLTNSEKLVSLGSKYNEVFNNVAGVLENEACSIRKDDARGCVHILHESVSQSPSLMELQLFLTQVSSIVNKDVQTQAFKRIFDALMFIVQQFHNRKDICIQLLECLDGYSLAEPRMFEVDGIFSYRLREELLLQILSLIAQWWNLAFDLDFKVNSHILSNLFKALVQILMIYDLRSTNSGDNHIFEVYTLNRLQSNANKIIVKTKDESKLTLIQQTVLKFCFGDALNVDQDMMLPSASRLGVNLKVCFSSLLGMLKTFIPDKDEQLCVVDTWTDFMTRLISIAQEDLYQGLSNAFIDQSFGLQMYQLSSGGQQLFDKQSALITVDDNQAEGFWKRCKYHSIADIKPNSYLSFQKALLKSIDDQFSDQQFSSVLVETNLKKLELFLQAAGRIVELQWDCVYTMHPENAEDNANHAVKLNDLASQVLSSSISAIMLSLNDKKYCGKIQTLWNCVAQQFAVICGAYSQYPPHFVSLELVTDMDNQFLAYCGSVIKLLVSFGDDCDNDSIKLILQSLSDLSDLSNSSSQQAISVLSSESGFQTFTCIPIKSEKLAYYSLDLLFELCSQDSSLSKSVPNRIAVIAYSQVISRCKSAMNAWIKRSGSVSKFPQPRYKVKEIKYILQKLLKHKLSISYHVPDQAPPAIKALYQQNAKYLHLLELNKQLSKLTMSKDREISKLAQDCNEILTDMMSIK
ncbi:hypothetical protein MIR68_005834 [Amoeboaphelidium protococcarum]|nr:hypothetical protein MIR68_005834 [Amoeboaphelidium protococcarum]